jgi:hypothetical protein
VCALLTPCLDPQIEYVMKIDVRQKRRSYADTSRGNRESHVRPRLQMLWDASGSLRTYADTCTGSLTARDSGTPRDIGAPDGAFRFSLQRRRPGGIFLRG